MTRRASLPAASVGLAVLLSACGGAPEDADADAFCEVQRALYSDLLPPDGRPTTSEAVQAFHDWSEDLEAVGTPEDIPDDARAGFEVVAAEAATVQEDQLNGDFPVVPVHWWERSGRAEEEVDAFSVYVGDACGKDALYPETGPALRDLPQVPELPIE